MKHMVNEGDSARDVAIGILDAVEVSVKEFFAIFEEVARGEPLDPQRAENLAAQSVTLLKGIVETRNALRLSADSPGVH